MSKIIVVDLGSITHQAIIHSANQKELQRIGKIPPEGFVESAGYSFFKSLISMLKKVYVDKFDTVILAGDGRNSWRKIFYPTYKGNRATYRATFDIDWPVEYGKVNKIIDNLNEATDFQLVWQSGFWNGLDLINTPEGEKYLNVENIDLMQEYSVEADDVAAVCCKVFKDKEIIMITKDKDWSMLCVEPIIKFFSMNVKYNGSKGVYQPIANGYKILDGKIRLGDKGDNIIVDKENDTEKDKEIRKLIIDLINLPSWVSSPIENILRNLPKKTCDFSKLPFPNSLALRFPQIYSPDKIITYEECIKRIERKETIAKNKKIKLKKEKTLRKVKK